MRGAEPPWPGPLQTRGRTPVRLIEMLVLEECRRARAAEGLSAKAAVLGASGLDLCIVDVLGAFYAKRPAFRGLRFRYVPVYNPDEIAKDSMRSLFSDSATIYLVFGDLGALAERPWPPNLLHLS